MSLLRPSIAGRLLRAGAPAQQRLIPATRRCYAQTPSGTNLTSSEKSQPAASTGESNMVNHESANSTHVRHNQPDYTAEVDQASSYVGPRLRV